MYGNLSERLAVVATVDPDVLTAAAHTTDEIDMQKWERVLFIIQAGTLGSSATLDFVVNGGASSNAGSHSTAITGTAITQLTQAGSDSDKQVLVEVSAEQVASQGLRYIEGVATVGTASSDGAIIVLGLHKDYSTAADYDLATVDEIISV